MAKARKCKCKICKKELTTDIAYLVEHITANGNKQKQYYCSKEEYENDKREKELYSRIQFLTDEILGYPCVNNIRNKKIKELKEVGYSNEVIYRCFKEYKDEIIKWIDTNKIDKEYNKIAYMFAVIGANIKDFSIEDERKNYWEQYKVEEEEIEIENIDIILTEDQSDDAIKERLKNKKKNDNVLNNFLKGLK